MGWGRDHWGPSIATSRSRTFWRSGRRGIWRARGGRVWWHRGSQRRKMKREKDREDRNDIGIKQEAFKLSYWVSKKLSMGLKPICFSCLVWAWVIGFKIFDLKLYGLIGILQNSMWFVLVRIQQIRGYTNRSSSLLCQSTAISTIDRALSIGLLWLSTGFSRESSVMQTGSVYRQSNRPINSIRPLGSFQIEFRVHFWIEFGVFGFLYS